MIVDGLFNFCHHIPVDAIDHGGFTLSVMVTILSLSPAVDCGALTNPDNGRVDTPQGTTFNQVATYSCNSGYGLVGNMTRTCQADGMWSGSEPICGKFITMVVVWEHTNVQCIERLFCSSLV